MNSFRFSVAGLLLTLACSAPLLAAPAPGQAYIVEGRCVIITRVQDKQVSYEWRDGNASGSGSLPAEWLGAQCTAGAARAQTPSQPGTPSVREPARSAPSNNDSARAATADAAGSDFAQQILRAHNRYRCIHGVPPLQWRNDVAAYAQAWIEKAGFNHSDSYRSPLGPMGENLYWSSQTPSGPEAPASWYSESQGYDYRREGSPDAGHFTAMIWKDARFVGCGRTGGVVSCNYSTGSRTMDCQVPNMRGCYVQQVLPASKDPRSCE